MIRLATSQDVPRLVQLHRESLPADMLPRLGESYLRNKYYAKLVNSPHALTVVWDEAGHVRSFVTFAWRSQDLAQEIKSDKVALGWALTARFFRDPKIFLEVLNFLRSDVTYEGDASELNSLPELYSIATDPRARGTGAGREIVKDGLARIRARGHKSCLVKTLSPQALRFYEKIGFKKVGTERRGPKELIILKIDFQSAAVQS